MVTKAASMLLLLLLGDCWVVNLCLMKYCVCYSLTDCTSVATESDIQENL